MDKSLWIAFLGHPVCTENHKFCDSSLNIIDNFFDHALLREDWRNDNTVSS